MVSEIINRIVFALEFVIIFPKEMSFIRRFLEIIYIASTKGYDSISSFLEYWKQHGHKEKTPIISVSKAVNHQCVINNNECFFLIVSKIKRENE